MNCKTCGANGKEASCAYPTEYAKQLESENAALKEQLAKHERALDEAMVSSCLGVFDEGDDPNAAINKLGAWSQDVGAYFAKAELEELREQLAAAQKDAERYRWLRDGNRGMHGLSCVINDECNPPYFELKCETELDAAIDQAMKEQKP